MDVTEAVSLGVELVAGWEWESEMTCLTPDLTHCAVGLYKLQHVWGMAHTVWGEGGKGSPATERRAAVLCRMEFGWVF